MLIIDKNCEIARDVHVLQFPPRIIFLCLIQSYTSKRSSEWLQFCATFLHFMILKRSSKVLVNVYSSALPALTEEPIMKPYFISFVSPFVLLFYDASIQFISLLICLCRQKKAFLFTLVIINHSNIQIWTDINKTLRHIVGAENSLHAKLWL